MLVGFFFFIFSLILIASGGAPETVPVNSGSLLHIKFDAPIVENAKPDPESLPLDELLPLPFGATQNMGLYQIIESLDYAAEDERIEGIFLNLQGAVPTGWANLAAIRQALIRFKATGKFIYAYSHVYSENSYYLTSVADSIFLPPEGLIEFNGFVSSPMFFAGLFEKLDFTPKIFRVGTYKGAVEPFIQKEMSPANREQTQTYLNDLWEAFAEDVAVSRNLSPEAVNLLATDFVLGDAESAKKAGLIDQVAYGGEVSERLQKALGLAREDASRWVSFKKYLAVASRDKAFSREKIAVINVEGTIMPGKSVDGVAGANTIVGALRKARQDNEVHAIILRINSPGGSMLAADLIRKEVLLALEEKPVMASFGDVAASGGYYIAAPCDSIFAQAQTLTGSIGIFLILYDAKDMLNNQLGLNFDLVETHEFAGIADPTQHMSPTEEAFFQRMTEKGYGTFINVVQEGRGFPDSLSVDKIAQGRVWTGKRAKSLSLIDDYASLKEVIAIAAERQGLESYRVEILPRAKTPVEELLESMKNVRSGKLQEQVLPPATQQLLKWQRMIPGSGKYLLWPYSAEVK